MNIVLCAHGSKTEHLYCEHGFSFPHPYLPGQGFYPPGTPHSRMTHEAWQTCRPTQRCPGGFAQEDGLLNIMNETLAEDWNSPEDSAYDEEE